MVPEPTHVDEPQLAQGYADVLSEVAAKRQPIIVRRAGEDLAAVIPLEYLDLMHDSLARVEAERCAGQLDWDSLVKRCPPDRSWFDEEEPKPF
jgi:hypothetical protein